MSDPSRSEEHVIPLVEEQVRVGKREITTGRVRITTEVHEHVEHVATDLHHSEVQIVRVPINRPVDAVPEVRTEGDVLIYPVVEEVVVVEKRLILKEELRVSRTRRTETFEQDVVLRSSEAVVERTPEGGSGSR